jgi:hypothetical protein
MNPDLACAGGGSACTTCRRLSPNRPRAGRGERLSCLSATGSQEDGPLGPAGHPLRAREGRVGGAVRAEVRLLAGARGRGRGPLSRLRRLGQRLRAGEVPQVPAGVPGGVLVQGAGSVPVVRCEEGGGAGGVPGRRGRGGRGPRPVGVHDPEDAACVPPAPPGAAGEVVTGRGGDGEGASGGSGRRGSSRVGGRGPDLCRCSGKTRGSTQRNSSRASSSRSRTRDGTSCVTTAPTRAERGVSATRHRVGSRATAHARPRSPLPRSGPP